MKTFLLSVSLFWSALAVAAAPRLAVFHQHLAEEARQRGVTIEETAKEALSLGITGVDIMDMEPSNSVERVLAAGMEVSRYVLFTDFAKDDSRPKIDSAFDFCRRHKVRHIMLVPGYFHTNEMSKAAAWAAMRPRLARFVAEAEQHGIGVDLEDFDWHEAVVGSQADLRQAFAAVPALGHVLDTGNYAYWGDDVLTAMKEFRTRIRHVHVKDRSLSEPRKSVPAGTGKIPLAEIIRCLRSSGYDGWWTIECFGSDDFRRDIGIAAAYLKSQMR